MVIRLSAQTPGGAVFYDSAVEADIKKYDIGSVCLFQGNPVRQVNFINHFQQITRTPLMFCIDAETGLGMRMYDSVMKFPDQLTIGAIQDSDLVYGIGRAIGEQCRRAGIQVNYAPVVDINNNPDNPVINFRSFGEDKYKVALFGTKMMQGIQDAGVMACAKHFPGHGDVSVDSHLDLPVIHKSIQELDSLELYPFKKLFEAGVGSVMIAHLSIPAIDTTLHLPTSLSKKNVTGLLRDKLGFKGISFTDALEMKGVSKYFPKGEASAKSLIAGNDMLCLPGDIPGSIKQIRRAIRRGELTWQQLNAKVRKVLLAKYNMGLDKRPEINTANLTPDLNADVKRLRAAVAEKALTLLRLKDSDLLPLQPGKHIAYVGIGIDSENTFAYLLHKSYGADCYYFGFKEDSSKASEILSSLDNKYDAVVIGLHGFNKYPSNNFGIPFSAFDLLKKIQHQYKSISFIFGNPYVIKNFCDAGNLVECYEDDSIFQKAAVDLLQGKIIPTGSLPVSVCDAFRYGSGIHPKDPFPVTRPESVAMSSLELTKIDSIANDAIARQATPGCVVLVARDGKVVFDKAYGYMTYDSIRAVTKGTVYDLASVTKISATTVSIMKLYEEGKLDIYKTLGDYLPWVRGTDKADLPIFKIMLHQAGLNPFIPFYRETIDTLTGIPKPGFFRQEPDSFYSVRVADHMFMRKDWIDTMYKRILDSKLTQPDKYVYSDNDFIFMGKVVQQISGMPLDQYAKENFYVPLHMSSTTFKPRGHDSLDLIAPTEDEKYFRLQLLHGDVHDPGAAMFGGVAGHAGLFSNAYDLSQLYEMLLNGGYWDGKRFLKKHTIDFFTAYNSNVSRRGLGFDKPEKDNATSPDPYPCKDASPLTFGHTGFTGICVWVDPKYNLIYIFLSNRVCPYGGSNLKLIHMNVRTKIQEVIYHALQNR